ncbi:MAG: hypothetical protein QW035_00090 [Candidatus Anstonellales archaeon]
MDNERSETEKEEMLHRFLSKIMNRYRDVIEEKEKKSVAELRSLVRPFHPVIASINSELEVGGSCEKAISLGIPYFSKFRTIHPPVSFWLDFPDIIEVKGADVMDKAIFFLSFLRSNGCEARIYVTKKNSIFVYITSPEEFLVSPDTWSVLRSEDARQVLVQEGPLYSFNDLSFEAYE